jgi:hypothetical protein
LQGLEHNFSEFLKKFLTLSVICRLIYRRACATIRFAHSEGKPFIYEETTSRIRWQAETPVFLSGFFCGGAALSGIAVMTVVMDVLL